MPDTELTFHYYPEPSEPLIKEGATVGWQVLWSGKPGPAMIRKVVTLADSDGVVTIEPVGDWEDTTVVDDHAPDR